MSSQGFHSRLPFGKETPLWKEWRAHQEQVLEHYCISLRQLRFDSKERKFVADTETRDRMKEELKVTYGVAHLVAQYALLAAVPIMKYQKYTIFQINFDMPLALDVPTVDRNVHKFPPSPEPTGQTLPEWKLLIEHENALKNLVLDEEASYNLLINKAFDKKTVELATSKGEDSDYLFFSVFERVLIIMLLYDFTYRRTHQGAYEGLYDKYMPEIKACYEKIVPELKRLPPPPKLPQFDADKLTVKRISYQLNSWFEGRDSAEEEIPL